MEKLDVMPKQVGAFMVGVSDPRRCFMVRQYQFDLSNQTKLVVPQAAIDAGAVVVIEDGNKDPFIN